MVTQDRRLLLAVAINYKVELVTEGPLDVQANMFFGIL